ncbi:hypothetical protein MFIFM68171_03833 [Madurella fahalii]|uniref:Ars binding protein 2 n=1 Tax=Madurella fahalii TaxID=1157608 RepID=A0ABQ0G786_9PEZI
MQHPSQPVLTASPTSMRPALPNRNVDADSIEDAYVAFILCCNPAVPLQSNTAALREAFRTPPKSGGKSFSTFTLFELIKKLETKELKTWAELALRLGVEPPDQEKGQSSQKIQQYAVRLKRWMHSMHVDAFFEYLIGRPSPYWTEIPSERTPVAELERDGVAAEDDMALRALLPHIKPRRGRRKPEEDETGKSPSQRPSPQVDEHGGGGGGGSRQQVMEPWTAQPDGRGSVFLFPPVPDASRSNTSAPSWGTSDIVQTPLTAYPIPQSAITPSTRNAFWADEPKSAITPSKPRSTSRRHGAKVVSSAWRSGGTGGSGKTRGRPPMNRGANAEGPFSAFPTSEGPAFRFPSPTPDKNPTSSHAAAAPTSSPRPPTSTITPHGPTPPPAPHPQPAQNQSQPSPILESPHPRPAKRSRLSLQVPERVGGEVRLATPPLPEPMVTPVVMVNGQAADPQTEPTAQGSSSYTQMPDTFAGVHLAPTGMASAHPQVCFRDPTDRTNMDNVETIFMNRVLTAEWYDAKHNQIPPCSADEAWGLTQRVIDNLRKTAATKEAFLINLAALAGGNALMREGSLRITRLEDQPDRTRYSCAWELRFGDITGQWTMEETVMHEKRKEKAKKDDTTAATPNGAGAADPGHWERRYKELAAALQKRDEELLRLRAKVMASIRDC